MNKIAFPHMGDYYVSANYLLSHIFPKDIIIKAPKITNKTIEIGTKYSPDFVCTPFKYTLGTMIESLEEGANILVQMGGGCRYGYYAELQEEILKELNYKCKVINLVKEGVTSPKRINKLLKQIDKKYSKIKAIYYSFMAFKMVKYMDQIDDYIRKNIGFEIKKGSFESLKEEMLISFSHIKGYNDLKKTYKRYLKKFKNIKVRKPDNPIKIGIIGELYTIMEPFSNYYLEKALAQKGIEITRFTNVYYLLFQKAKKFKKYQKYSKNYFKYSMGADASDNIARCKYLCENKYDGIIHIKSSFCTPEIGAMPIINNLAAKYNIPVLFFSFDSATSETGVITRLEAFYDMLEMRRRKWKNVI